jgi:hypothetical protein
MSRVVSNRGPGGAAFIVSAGPGAAASHDGRDFRFKQPGFGESVLWTEFNGFYSDWATLTGEAVQVLIAVGTWIAIAVTASVGPLSKAVLPAVGKWQAVSPGISRGGVNVAVLPAPARWIALPVAAVTGFTVQVLAAVAKWIALTAGVDAGAVAGETRRSAWPFWRGKGKV